MSSLTGNRTVVMLSLLVTGAALVSYAVLPIAAFAQNDGSQPKWNDKHFEKHHWDKDSKSYKDDSGKEYKCETHHDDSWYYFYNGEFYKCDDYKPASPSETPY
ncbi:MAG TPA: hypothetical protein VF016_07415 [Nitrososphaera sp.]|jgi:hypothetical protein|nr:hypothetical protein [uncultured Nitrososphaera sp.]